MHAPVDHRRVQMVRAGDDVGDDLGFLRVWHRRLEHANDRRRPIAQANGPADDGRVAPEGGRPEPVRQDSRAFRFRPVVSRVEEAAHHRPQAHDLEIGSADDAGANGARFAEPDHRELDGREVAESGDGFHSRLQVAELRHREVGVLDADALGRLADIDQAVLVAVDQGPQQHAADDAEDGRVRANPQRQRHDDGEGQALGSGERPKGELEVSQERHEPVVQPAAGGRSFQ